MLANSTLPAPKILVVDDEPDIRQLLRLYFERQGFSVTLACDGCEGVEKARQVHPDVILMDIQMPRKTGIEAVGELRADGHFEHTPIIAITAYAHVKNSSEILRAGFDYTFLKPIDFAGLTALVSDAIRDR